MASSLDRNSHSAGKAAGWIGAATPDLELCGDPNPHFGHQGPPSMVRSTMCSGHATLASSTLRSSLWGVQHRCAFTVDMSRARRSEPLVPRLGWGVSPRCAITIALRDRRRDEVWYIYIYICVCDVCSRAPEPAPEHVMKRKMRGCGPWPFGPYRSFDGSWSLQLITGTAESLESMKRTQAMSVDCIAVGTMQWCAHYTTRGCWSGEALWKWKERWAGEPTAPMQHGLELGVSLSPFGLLTSGKNGWVQECPWGGQIGTVTGGVLMHGDVTCAPRSPFFANGIWPQGPPEKEEPKRWTLCLKTESCGGLFGRVVAVCWLSMSQGHQQIRTQSHLGSISSERVPDRVPFRTNQGVTLVSIERLLERSYCHSSRPQLLCAQCVGLLPSQQVVLCFFMPLVRKPGFKPWDTLWWQGVLPRVRQGCSTWLTNPVHCIKTLGRYVVVPTSILDSSFSICKSLMSARVWLHWSWIQASPHCFVTT